VIADKIRDKSFGTGFKKWYLPMPVCPTKGRSQEMIGMVVQTMQKGKSSSSILIIELLKYLTGDSH
jgi:hypothetical protein